MNTVFNTVPHFLCRNSDRISPGVKCMQGSVDVERETIKRLLEVTGCIFSLFFYAARYNRYCVGREKTPVSVKTTL